MSLSRSICISHESDVDGIGSAALMKRLYDPEVLLVDYGNFMETLKSVRGGVDDFYLCDLGTSSATSSEFLAEVKKITSFATFTYIDHHPISSKAKEELTKLGVNLIHSDTECTSVLIYESFKEKLSPKFGLIAAYGAVTDYMDGSPKAKKIIEGYDRQFVLFEATMLSYAIVSRKDTDFLDWLVKGLSQGVNPHEIRGVRKRALAHLSKMSSLISELETTGKRFKNFAFVETDEDALGMVASSLLGPFQVPVGVASKVKEGDFSEISLRASSDFNLHLGVIAERIAEKLGGSGGGHAKASGLRILKRKMDSFLEILDKELGKS